MLREFDPLRADAMAESQILLTPPTHHEIVITRVINAPRELVFDAWTKPEHLAQWWGPGGFAATVCEVDLRVGGRFRLDLRGPDGIDYPCDGIYHEILRPERIVYSGMADDRHPCGAGIPPHSMVTIHFLAQAPAVTRLSINARLPSVAACEAAVQAGFVAGWKDALERLHLSIETD